MKFKRTYAIFGPFFKHGLLKKKKSGKSLQQRCRALALLSFGEGNFLQSAVVAHAWKNAEIIYVLNITDR